MVCPSCSTEVNVCDSCGGTPAKLEHRQFEQTALHLCPNCAPRVQKNPEMLKKILEKKATQQR